MVKYKFTIEYEIELPQKNLVPHFCVDLELIVRCWPYNPSNNVSTLNAIFNFDLNPHVKKRVSTLKKSKSQDLSVQCETFYIPSGQPGLLNIIHLCLL